MEKGAEGATEPGGTTLEHLLATLGPGVLQLLAAPSGTGVAATSLAVHDPTDPPAISRGTVLLGIGLTPGRELSQLMQRVAAEGAILLLKAAPAQSGELAEEARREGTSLVSVAHGAAWLQILSLLRSAMQAEPARRGEELGGVAAGDLFAVANAVAAVIDAPVTIEDPQSRVLAYSARQDEADEPRRVTILGRQVPDEYFRRLQSSGQFRRIYSSAEPVYVDDIGPGVLPRLAVAVRAGDELLGSVWAAVRERPDRRRIEEFARAARFVAIHLLRHRIDADLQRGLHTELMTLVLDGGPLAADAASRLGLAGEAFRVVAAGMRQGDAVDNQLPLARLADTLSLHLSVLHRRAGTAVIGGVVYAVIPTGADAEASRQVAHQTVDSFLARLPAAVARAAIVAIGGQAQRLEDVPGSRRDADRVLRVLRRVDAGDTPPAVADIEEMHMHVLLDRLAEVAANEPIIPMGALRLLFERDAKHRSHLVETLRAYLDCFGDVALAARRLQVHHNTLRYRIERLREIPGLDLDDPEQRLALQLQLRWLPRSDSRRASP